MEVHQSERRTRSSKRKPLSNLTNTQSLSFSSSSALSLKPNYKPKASDQRSSLFSNLDATSVKCGSSTGSSGRGNPGDRIIPKSRSPSKEISKNFVTEAIKYDKSKHSIVYPRQSTEGRKDKGKAVAATVALSCPPVQRIRSIGGKLKVENREVVLPSTFSVPCQKIKKKQRYSEPEDEVLQEPSLPQDFIEKQRAYFAEIDAFNLVEEVVSESEYWNSKAD